MLNFLAHEYFHLYNVKRIRPIALGPFDYDRENLTNMLWVSEGFTSLLRGPHAPAGRTHDGYAEILDDLGRCIAATENNTGHLFQSAVQSSFETWSQGPFGRRRRGPPEDDFLYDKGEALGWLLDLAIRRETRNARSLDTVMRLLYETYYKTRTRLDRRRVRGRCESVAGAPLREIFEYASTTKEVVMPNTWGYAGLELEAPRELPAAFGEASPKTTPASSSSPPWRKIAGPAGRARRRGRNQVARRRPGQRQGPDRGLRRPRARGPDCDCLFAVRTGPHRGRPLGA